MSGEFRSTYGGYMHSVLENLDDDGRHEVSKALFKLYKALAPFERDCAWYEACDSTASVPALGIIEKWEAIEKAFLELKSIKIRTDGFVRDIIDTYERKKADDAAGF